MKKISRSITMKNCNMQEFAKQKCGKQHYRTVNFPKDIY